MSAHRLTVLLLVFVVWLVAAQAFRRVETETEAETDTHTDPSADTEPQRSNVAVDANGRRLHHLVETDSARKLPDSEIEALRDLYFHTNGDYWIERRGWDTIISGETDPCTWFGIVCADNHTGILNHNFTDLTRIREPRAGHVLEINLSNNNLTGPLPLTIGDFTFLRHLYLSSNSISFLPDEVGHLEYLTHARIWNNLIEGPLPSTLGDLTNLEFLSLGRNQFSGTIPSSIENLQKLSVLYLQQNYLEDPLPDALINRSLMPRLKTVYLFKNLFQADRKKACKERYCAP